MFGPDRGIEFRICGDSQDRVEEPSAAAAKNSLRGYASRTTRFVREMESNVVSLHVEEISNRPFRITSAGDVNFPLVGRVFAAGLRIEQLEAILTERLEEFTREPNVVVNVVKFNRQPVSVLGAVGPGGRSLTEWYREVLSLAGRGNCGRRVAHQGDAAQRMGRDTFGFSKD